MLRMDPVQRGQSVVPECDQPDDTDDHDPSNRNVFTLPAKLFCHS